MKTILYHAKRGKAIADGVAEELARQFLLDPNKLSIAVSTENFIAAIRCLVMEDVYPHDQVTIVFDGSKLLLDSDGRMITWPVGFCDYSEGFLLRLLKGRGTK